MGFPLSISLLLAGVQPSTLQKQNPLDFLIFFIDQKVKGRFSC